MRLENFKPDLVKKVSLAASFFGMWVKNTVNYHRIFMLVKPLRERVD